MKKGSDLLLTLVDNCGKASCGLTFSFTTAYCLVAQKVDRQKKKRYLKIKPSSVVPVVKGE
jgi:hypothetical protein